MKQVDQCVAITEGYVKQLEGLAYSKNAALAAKLVGAIEAMINVTEVASDGWNSRVQVASTLIMREKPGPDVMKTDNLPTALAAGVAAITPGKTNPTGTLPQSTAAAALPQLVPTPSVDADSVKV